MNESFGPWATAVATGANPQLNTFWKRRLAMLSSLSRSNLRITRRTGLMLAVLALAGFAVPTLKPGIENGFAGQKGKSEAGAAAQSAAPGAAPAVGAGSEDITVTGVDEYFPRPTATERRFLDALEQPVDADFREMPLEKCLDALETQARIDFWLDQIKLAEEGVKLEQPVTLKLKGRRLASALNLLLRPLQLDYIYEDEVLKVTTASSAADILLTRIYPVGDLCPELKEEKEPAEAKNVVSLEDTKPQIRLALFQGFGGGGMGGGMGGGGMGGGGRRKISRFASLMNAITITVQPDSWEELSGPGSVVSVAATNSLVIRQTRSVHREVLQLLRDLRAAKRMPQAAPGRAIRAEEAEEGERRGGGFF